YDVSAADHEADLRAGVDDLLDFLRVLRDRVEVEARAMIAGKRLTGELEQHPGILERLLGGSACGRPGHGRAASALAHLEAHEAADIGARRLLHELADRLRIVANPGLFEERDLLDELVEATGDHLLDDRLRLSALLGLRHEDRLLARDE